MRYVCGGDAGLSFKDYFLSPTKRLGKKATSRIGTREDYSIERPIK